MFSSRLPARIEPNRFARALREARRSGTALVDLTESNPTTAGFTYPADVCSALADPGALRYEPEPMGPRAAREAVAGAIGADADALLLTASTSEAYSLLFKLLCDPADEVLVPTPGYPLFGLLTGLEAVRAVPYRLDRSGGWCLDRDGLLRALSPRTRAVLVVSPANPTGSVLHDLDREWLLARAAERGLAVIADEVFADYLLQPACGWRSLSGDDRVLVFTLGGLSKSAGLPQMKLAWVSVSGPAALVEAALARLEVIADTYLSVATPVARAVLPLIEAGRRVRAEILARLEHNLETLRSVVGRCPDLTLLEPEGGWSAVVRVPAVEPEEELVVRLLREASVVVHPGYFFDFDEEGLLVVSLLPEPDTFAEGIGRLSRAIAGDRR